MSGLTAGTVIWSEHMTGAVRALAPGGAVRTLHELQPPLYHLKLVSNTLTAGLMLIFQYR